MAESIISTTDPCFFIQIVEDPMEIALQYSSIDSSLDSTQEEIQLAEEKRKKVKNGRKTFNTRSKATKRKNTNNDDYVNLVSEEGQKKAKTPRVQFKTVNKSNSSHSESVSINECITNKSGKENQPSKRMKLRIKSEPSSKDFFPIVKDSKIDGIDEDVQIIKNGVASKIKLEQESEESSPEVRRGSRARGQKLTVLITTPEIEKNNLLKKRRKITNKTTKSSPGTKKSLQTRTSRRLEENKNSPPNLEDSNFVCAECKKPFKYQSELTAHERTHSGEKPFECSDCGLKFSQNSHLKRHKLTHLKNPKKKFKCDSCGKKFLQKYSLDVHLRVHSGEKPYSCGFCSKLFATSSHLTTHAKSHMEREYECDTCGKKFILRSHLSSHQSRIHGLS